MKCLNALYECTKNIVLEGKFFRKINGQIKAAIKSSVLVIHNVDLFYTPNKKLNTS